MRNTTRGGWLKDLTPSQRARVKAVLSSREDRQNTSGGGQLWIKYSPTTGIPRDVVLHLKTHDGQLLRVWRIWPPDEEEDA